MGLYVQVDFIIMSTSEHGVIQWLKEHDTFHIMSDSE